jgi:hypothetical protein
MPIKKYMNRYLIVAFSSMVFFILGVHVVVFIGYVVKKDYELSSIASVVSGFTMPVLSLFGSLLLYYTLVKQSEANEKTQKKIDLDEEKVYLDYFLKCQTEWINIAYKNRGTLHSMSVSIEDRWMTRDLLGLLDSIKKATDQNQLNNRLRLFNTYCARQIPPIARVSNAFTSAKENIISEARKEILLVELDIFNMQIMSRGDILFLKRQVDFFLFNNKELTSNEFYELMNFFEYLWGSSESMAN